MDRGALRNFEGQDRFTLNIRQSTPGGYLFQEIRTNPYKFIKNIVTGQGSAPPPPLPLLTHLMSIFRNKKRYGVSRDMITHWRCYGENSFKLA